MRAQRSCECERPQVRRDMHALAVDFAPGHVPARGYATSIVTRICTAVRTRSPNNSTLLSDRSNINVSRKMTDHCRHPQSCSCSRRSAECRIVASNNAVGPAIASHVPEVLLTLPSTPTLNFGYLAANSEDDRLGMEFRRSIARVE